MKLHPEKIRVTRLLLFAVLALALLLRVAYLFFNMQSPDFRAPVLDPQLNDYWARALVSGDWTPPPHADNPEIQTTPYGRPPAYPWVLAAIYQLTNGSYLAPRIVQLLVGLLNIVLVFVLGRRLSGNGTGIIAALFMAIFWAAIYFEGELNSPVWEVLFALGMILCLLRWSDTSAARWLAAAGSFLGVGALMRPNVLLAGCAVLVWVVWYGYRSKINMGRLLVMAAVFAGTAVLVIFPVLVRNWIVGGQFVFISYYGGINAYIGNNPHAEGTSPEVPDLYEISGVEEWNCFNYPSIVRGLARHLGEPDFNFSKASRYFYKRAFAFWRYSPLQALRLTLRKAWLFWGPHEISDSKVVHYERVQSKVLSWLPRFSLLLALALTGLIAGLLFRKADSGPSRETALLLICFIAGYFCSILPFFISERYRFPVVPFLLPFSGYAVVLTWQALREKNGRALFVIVFVLFSCSMAVSYPFLPYSPSHSTWHLHRGLAYAAQGETEEAEAAFMEALRQNPDNDEAHLQLGYIHAQQGLQDDAMGHYRRALEVNPNNVFAANNLGYEHYLKDDYAEAEKYYRQALTRHPIYTLALNNLGNTLLAQGRAEEALKCFEKTLCINPHDPFARYNMGNVYLQTEEYDKAVEIFQQTFEEQPFNPNIANNLGLALAHAGQFEAAIPWFEKALSLAGQYPLAHFNLGNVFGDLGEIEKACYHYEQVLSTWPEHEETLQRHALLCGKRSGE